MPTLAPAPLPLDHQQRQRLRAEAAAAALGTAAFLLTLLAVGVVLLAKLLEPPFASRGQLLLALPLAAFWLWRLWPALARLRLIRRDLRANQASWVEGLVQSHFNLGIGLFKTVTYSARVGGWQGRLSQADFRQLQPGAVYRVYFALHSRTFLGAVPVEPVMPSLPGATGAGANSPPQPAMLDPLPADSPLTPREVELLRLVAAGHSNKEIAARLALSPNTVKMYNSVIYEKLGVRRRTEAVARARALGLL